MAVHTKNIQCRQFENGLYAFGMAVNLLRRTQPFSSYEFGKFANVLMGQVRRKHYALAISAGYPVGYVGWALCQEHVARAWVESRHVPSFAECTKGDCWVGITFHAESTPVCWALSRFCRIMYPGYKIFGIRDYGVRQRSTNLSNRAFELESENRTVTGNSREKPVTSQA